MDSVMKKLTTLVLFSVFAPGVSLQPTYASDSLNCEKFVGAEFDHARELMGKISAGEVDTPETEKALSVLQEGIINANDIASKYPYLEEHSPEYWEKEKRRLNAENSRNFELFELQFAKIFEMDLTTLKEFIVCENRTMVVR